MLSNHNLIIFIAFAFLAGCTSLSEDFANKAEALKMKREIMTGMRFQHVIYKKSGLPSKTLHIYLDGDGTPWAVGRPSDDPTPRNPLLLRLMALDKAPAVYVGRPCYHGVTAIGGCSSRFWLKDRYSEEVVSSLAAIVNKLLSDGHYQKVTWFGHSGGGTLAVLLASRFQQTVSVVSVAANLDVEAWAAYTQHIDLSGSLNPAHLPPLPRTVLQRHYAGSEDRVVPPPLMAKAAAQLGSELLIINDYDHVCCWEQLWPAILAGLPE